MQLRKYVLALTTTGGAGVASASGTITVEPAAYMEWVYYDFHASAPATTDVTGTNANTPPGGQVFGLSNSATDTLQFPRAAAVSTTGAAITDSNAQILLSGPITVSVAQCDALTDAVTVTLAVRES